MKRKTHNLRDTAIAVALLPLGLALGFLLVQWLEKEEGENAVAKVTRSDGKDAGSEVEIVPEIEAEGEGDASGEISGGAPAQEVELASSDEQPPVLASEGAEPVEMKEEVPVEKTGGIGDPDDRTADAPQVTADEVDLCDEILELAKGASPFLKKEGPVRAGFEVEFDGLLNPWSLMTLDRLPEDLVTVNVIEEGTGRSYRFESDHGRIVEAEDDFATWEAPKEPGIYCLKIFEDNSENLMCLHVAVKRPWDGKSETLNGYRIGKYQDKPYRENPRYRKPRGFIEVTEENEDMWISPHLQLSQFVCKQEGDYPKYLLVDTRLLLKLEELVAELEESGREASHLYISSGFRTPAYNAALGNKTIYSRHLYGDAADLFVDSNRDGRLDDLDFSGSTDDKDAQLIQRAVESITEDFRYMKGGLGFYSGKSYRNPFIHVDTRGYPARWKR